MSKLLRGNFRRVTGIMIVILMLFTLLPVNANASPDSLVFSVSEGIVGHRNHVVNVEVRIDSNPGATSASLFIEFNPTVLSPLPEVTPGDIFERTHSTFFPELNRILIAGGDAVGTPGATGIFVTLRFLAIGDVGDFSDISILYAAATNAAVGVPQNGKVSIIPVPVLTYTVDGDKPSSSTPKVPEEASIPLSHQVRVLDNLTTTETTDAAGSVGTWTFSGWVSEQVDAAAGETFDMPQEDVEFKGTWKFTRSGGDGGNNNSGGGNTVTDDEDDNDEYVFEDPAVPLAPFIEDHIWYVRGFPDGEFKPENSITRAEIAMILWRLIDSEAKYSPQAGKFSDVQPESWYEQAVNYLASHNILIGFEDGTFRPNNPITRAELTAVMSRFFELDDNGVADFSDVHSDYWAFAYINNSCNRDWGDGFSDGTFRPNNATTRAEAVTMINRVLERVPDSVTINNKLENHLYDLIGVTELFTDITNAHGAFYEIMEAAIGHEFHLKEHSEVWETISIPWFSNPGNIVA